MQARRVLRHAPAGFEAGAVLGAGVAVLVSSHVLSEVQQTVDDVVIVDTPDALLVTTRARAQEVIRV